MKDNKIAAVSCECPACGVSYLADPGRLKWGRETTCSRACSYKLRASKLASFVEAKCSLCERSVQRCPSHMKGKHGALFCSRECHYAARGLGLTKRVVTKPYQYPAESMWKLRQAGAKAMTSGALPPSKHEIAVSDALKRLNVPFVHQQKFEAEPVCIVVDFYFPAMARVIEVDGPEHLRAARRAEDASRDEFLASIGIVVTRVLNGATPADTARDVLLALGA